MPKPVTIQDADAYSRLMHLIAEAIILADRAGRDTVGIHLNAALVALTGDGVPPPDFDR